VAILVGQATPDLVLSAVRLPADFAEMASTIVHQIERDTAQHPQLKETKARTPSPL
jgi:hypothetical protein